MSIGVTFHGRPFRLDSRELKSVERATSASLSVDDLPTNLKYATHCIAAGRIVWRYYQNLDLAKAGIKWPWVHCWGYQSFFNIELIYDGNAHEEFAHTIKSVT